MNSKSVQEVSKQLNNPASGANDCGRFSKTDLRYWNTKVFQPSYTHNGDTRFVKDWAVKIQWRGHRETFNLKTPNKAAAVAKARDIYTMLIGAGWDATLEKFKPEMMRKSVSTVGDLWSEMLIRGQTLKPAIERLRRLQA